MQDGDCNLYAIMCNLGSSFQARFGLSNDLNDLARAISSFQAAVDLTPVGHDDKPALMSSLGGSFQLRFESLGDISDLDKAIGLKQMAIELTPDGHHNYSCDAFIL